MPLKPGVTAKKLDQSSRLVVLFVSLYFAVAFFIPVHTPFLEDLYHSSYAGVEALSIRIVLTVTAAVSSILLWVFCRYRRLSRGPASVIAVGLLLPVVILEVPRELLRYQRKRLEVSSARIKTQSRLISMEDEELISAAGHPLGVRLRYQVSYPEGGEIIEHVPAATLSTAPLPYSLGFGVWKKEVRSLNGTVHAITVDLLPDFMPRAIAFPGYSTDPRDFCFNWPHRAAGPWGDSSRDAVLDKPEQAFRIDLGTPVYRALTRRTYHLRRFYEGARQEGAKECP